MQILNKRRNLQNNTSSIFKSSANVFQKQKVNFNTERVGQAPPFPFALYSDGDCGHVSCIS